METAGRKREQDGRQKKRLDGLSREVYLLTGGVTPASIMPVVPAPIGEKRPQSKVRWVLKKFTSSARKDGAVFEHWGKVGETFDDHQYARFNKSIMIITYTAEEYREHLASLQPTTSKGNPGAASATGAGYGLTPPWSKEETDELFRLCRQYDLRYTVIHDRWPVPNGCGKKGRTVDELKDRYYSVARKLIEVRTRNGTHAQGDGALAKHCSVITGNPYDFEYERERKAQIEKQYVRSKIELREEEEIVREARRIEASRKRVAKEKQRLTRLLAPAGDIASVTTPHKADGPSSGTGANESGTGHENGPTKLFPHRKQTSGPYARSNIIYTPVTQSTRVSKRIDTVLEELHVGLRPLLTAKIVDQYDYLRLEIAAYLELQRTVLRKEEETHNLRIKLAKLKGDPVPAPPPGVTLSHKKRRADDWEPPSVFGTAGASPNPQAGADVDASGANQQRKRRKH